jgi:hypothetical protein
LVIKRVDELTFPKLLTFANAAGLIILLIFTLLGGGFAAFFYGLPTLLAANGFAVFGWLLIVMPSATSKDA